MVKLTPSSVATIVLAGILVLVLGAGSYLVSSRMNRDAENARNSASEPISPGRINEQPMKDRSNPRQNEPPLELRAIRVSTFGPRTPVSNQPAAYLATPAIPWD